MKNILLLILFFTTVFYSCKSKQEKQTDEMATNHTTQQADTVQTALGPVVLPKPYTTKSVVNQNTMKDWPEGILPTAPEGFTVTKYADGFKNPRWTYIAPNGDMFVCEANTRGSAGLITLLRDTDGDGKADVRETFIDELKQPFGMLVIGNYFYVANTDGLYKYPYKAGQTSLKASEGTKIVELPAGGYNNHWTRNIITNAAKDKIYISVGSASNVAEHGMDVEIRRANILEVDLNGQNEKIYASGLRNPVGMDWNPITGELWTAVNERDELGDDLVPDYITSVKEGGFYGWPYSYFGQLEDPRLEGQAPELVAKSIVPDVSVGPHTASLGLTFYDADTFPAKYKNGVFVGQHGSWNRSTLSGYRVVFIRFENGKPAAQPEDFLTGFIANENKSEVYGRPVCVAVTPEGDLLVNDDAGNVIWKVSYSK
ncbi:PQQ-dependent sugar dehydrogenase [Aequorivita viscosa]|uniref:Glucose/arabinose dehydrogenase, beta-propeller fold n=1 Tax=Aequorivita viscosa TaxID=797419 RepID=A0A1M6ENQ1_9FLAO|nr:sorbosone dehydrogenase family protein [Aequorivita viscosa]SDW03547.1 Glucose/arabinose dehydrogenase, beta-propeller fold [Aequorivita viscosa]SHI86958.1 Glucose/arabinose dehydrogenase, beta-propeller fold [Aequorivita viscosa]